MARRRRTAPPSKGWKAPPQGSRARSAMPRHAFGDERGRRFPFKRPSKPFNPRTGKYPAGTTWRVDPRGLYAALSRAGQTGDVTVQRRIRRRINPIRKKQGKPPLKA